MAIRLHELHPTLVHYPLVLVPLAFLSDLFGRVTGCRSLMRLGKGLMPIAAASGVATAAAGLAAQEAVNVPEGAAHDMLITHRNLNAGMVGLVGVLAITRLGRERPGTGYLLAGLAVMAGMSYTAYLGGKMVYQHGVGVAPAGGVADEKSPDICQVGLEKTARVAANNIRNAAGHALHHLREGRIAPSLSKQESTGSNSSG